MTHFVQLTDITVNDQAPLLINADHVVYVRAYNGKTWVGTTALNEGSSRVFIVAETEREVWLKLSPVPGRS